MPFQETAETRRYGFDVPFPEVARKTFAVDDYGARADGVTDCTSAFYDAVADALAYRRPAEILFRQRGHYFFRPNRARGSDDLAILNVRKASNLLIRGQGADTVLVMGDPALGGLFIDGGDTVMLRDFAVDYNPLGFTQGTVVDLDADAGAFTLRLDPGYPTPARIAETVPGNHAGYRISQAGNGAYKWPVIGSLFPRSFKPLPNGDWRFETDPAALKGYMDKGDLFIFVGRRIAQQALTGGATRGFYVKNVVVHASPTCGLGLWGTDGTNIDGYADCPPAGSNRLLASNADGLFVNGARGGLTIKNCYFMGQGDDCINLHCPAFTTQSVTPLSDTELSFTSFVNIHPGDRLEIMDPNIGKIRGQVGVASATKVGDGLRVTTDGPLSAIGYDPKTDWVYPASLAAPNFKVVHNYFGQNRSRCVLVSARDGLLQANTDENAEGYGFILGYGGTAWAEGIIPSRVTVRDNLFRNVTNVGMAGTIEIGDGSEFRNFHDITIENNRFLNPRKMAITAAGVLGLRIVGNTVATDDGHRQTWNHPQWYPVDCSIYLRNCAGVVIDKFSLRDHNLRDCGIFVGKTCDPGLAGVKLSGLVLDLALGVPTIADERK